MERDGSVSIASSVHRTIQTSGFDDIVRGILGNRYKLSVVFIGDKKALKLNRIYRKKDAPANVLTFPLTDIEGEMFINVSMAKRHAKRNGFTEAQYVRYLLIHGCLHLKGYTHGSTMEEAEDAYVERFILR